jgi:hypothetical protein
MRFKTKQRQGRLKAKSNEEFFKTLYQANKSSLTPNPHTDSKTVGRWAVHARVVAQKTKIM